MAKGLIKRISKNIDKTEYSIEYTRNIPKTVNFPVNICWNEGSGIVAQIYAILQKRI